jgi:hypothetical protein
MSILGSGLNERAREGGMEGGLRQLYLHMHRFVYVCVDLPIFWYF